MGEFRMPSLGADMERGTVVEWRVRPGDEVHRGDIVAVVDTEKSTIEVEVFDSGVVEELLVPEGAEVDVGTALATIRSVEEVPGAHGEPLREAVAPRSEPTLTEVATATPATPTPVGAPAPAPPPGPPAGPAPGHHRVLSPLVRRLADQLDVGLDEVPASGPGDVVTRADVEAARWARTARGPGVASPTPSSTEGRRRASPLARRRAAAAGLDLTAVAGSGPGGAVVARDLDHATAPATGPHRLVQASAPASTRSATPPGTGPPADAARARVAALMARSKREVPHFYLRTTIDLAATTAWIEDINRDRPPAERLVPSAALLWATARAAAAHPGLNGHWVDGAFHPVDRVLLGVAVSLRGGGLVVPVLTDANQLSVVELMARLRDLTGRARRGVLRSSELVTPSLTVTNLGDGGVEEVFGVIYPPQVALVGFGRVVERPWAVGGMLAVRPVVTATLSADHRAANGHDGARLLSTIDHLLQGPEGSWNATGPTR